MARITVEDCLAHENNRFALVQLAAQRTKQLLGGARVLIPDARGNKPVVVSLREIADGLVTLLSHEELRVLAEDDLLKKEKAQKERAEALLSAKPTSSVDEAILSHGLLRLSPEDNAGNEPEEPVDAGGAPSPSSSAA